MFFIAGIAISFFLSALLLFKKNKSTADNFLACWLAVIGMHLLLFVSFISGKIYSYPWLLGFHFPLPLLHGPFLYLYAAALTGKPDVTNKKYLLHFIPVILCYVYLIPFFLLPPEQKIFVFKHKGAGHEIFLAVNIFAIIISGIVYVTLTVLLHTKHRRNILNQFSNTEKINLDWIQYLMYGIAIIWLFVIYGDDNLVFGAAVFFVLFMGFFGIRQTPVFTTHYPLAQLPLVNKHFQQPNGPAPENTISEDAKNKNETSGFSESTLQIIPEDETGNTPVTQPAPVSNSEKGKYQKSGLSEKELAFIHKRLTDLMQDEKLYANPELTLGDIAQKLDIHPNYLSQVINSVAKINFYDYINFQRVEEFKRLVLLPKNQKFTLLSLAFECGFNSKTSFNRNFRKATGLSPSEYLRLINVRLSQAS